ncbi:hypothetical protein CISG_06631 [Coccidioides immitis RMSCC 3703]|uniref:Uncharacterized protein n=2 Tax=Coccidioides immitis TaxID=5501 RepID=A0A0J8QWW7_COCIT|nr:hypothetical protein CIRG_02632 [Coccidioides immitis RMSCC 2394]KMU77384.1 hypothetical protein CISG_06631 [Coccidioides immitis RMSCC 3703]
MAPITTRGDSKSNKQDNEEAEQARKREGKEMTSVRGQGRYARYQIHRRRRGTAGINVEERCGVAARSQLRVSSVTPLQVRRKRGPSRRRQSSRQRYEKQQSRNLRRW